MVSLYTVVADIDNPGAKQGPTLPGSSPLGAAQTRYIGLEIEITMINNTNDDSWMSLPRLDKDCFGCGSENHSGLQMTFETNGNQIRSRLTVPSRFRGWSKLVHGGVISTILDETMSWAAIILTKSFILTKKMTIQFQRPIYVESALCGIASIKEKNGERKAIVTAELFDDQGRLCATSEGEFVLYTKEQFAKLDILQADYLESMAADLHYEK
jgi:uncharacterized protein (TIGR00369 family)